VITVQELTMVSATSDPAQLYRTYQDLSRAFDTAAARVDVLADKLHRLADDNPHRRELAAELDELSIGRTVLLGWVSAYFAAYSFALHGTDTELMSRAARAATAFLDTAGNPIGPAVPHPITRWSPR
jgi:hypothetical protein